MSVYTESRIEKMFVSNFKCAVRKLSELRVFCGRPATFSGLGGWVYEQTIHYCLKRELKSERIKVEIKEQFSLGARVKADLKVSNVVIEIKNGGLFDSLAAAKYGRYAGAAKAMGFWYLFVTRREGHLPYRKAIIKSLGKKNVFFLDASGEWRRFLDRVAELLPERS